jgi:hypothetical protein
VLKRIESERESVIRTAKQLGRELSPDEKRRISKSAAIRKYLDSGAGACHLARPEGAEIVADAIQFSMDNVIVCSPGA